MRIVFSWKSETERKECGGVKQHSGSENVKEKVRKIPCS